MDKMIDLLNLKAYKTAVTGLLGTIVPILMRFAGDAVKGMLGNMILLVGLLTGLASLFYLIKINSHRNIIKAIEAAQAESKLCQRCLAGEPPVNCPLPESDRPKACPLRYRLSWFGRLKKKIKVKLMREETTTL